jgi:hypothetical protein
MTPNPFFLALLLLLRVPPLFGTRSGLGLDGATAMIPPGILVSQPRR